MSADRSDVLRFPIRFKRAESSLALLGISVRNSFIEVGPDDIAAEMGWAFSCGRPARRWCPSSTTRTGW